MKNMLLFRVGTRSYAIDLTFVRGIQSVKHITDEGTKGEIPFGQMQNEEQTAPYDLVSFFENESVDRDHETEKMIMVEDEGLSMGLIVSRVDNVITVDREKLQPLSPIFKKVAASCFPQVLKHEDRLILLLAPVGIAKALQTETNFDVKPPAADDVVLDILPEAIDTTDIDHALQYDSASFLNNLLQTDRDF
ncbi:MAG: chemotaxis protein CheW [Desulfobacterales bacterium]